MSERLEDAAEIVLLTFTTPELLDEYQQRQELDLPVLVDPDRGVYAAYGLGRGSFRQVWGWATIRRYVQILRPSGSRRRIGDLAPATEDTRQLGGDFVITPDGRLAWGHWSTGPADRPDVDEIVAAVHRAGR